MRENYRKENGETFPLALYRFQLLYQIFQLMFRFLGKEYWLKTGRDELAQSLERVANTGVARNVILFVGDGMGPNTVTAARIYKIGETGRLSFEKFPYMGLLKV